MIPVIVHDPGLRTRIDDVIRRWRVAVDETSETPTAWLAFGTRGDQPVVLKVIKREGDEWRSGDVIEAFQGRGVVRVHEHVAGAVLLERATPGESLAVVTGDDDEEATAILAGLIAQMSGCAPPPRCPTVQDWATAFEHYLASGDARIPRDLVEHGHREYRHLAASQRRTLLLHGDLHHHNVLRDRHRGWLAIDPKGVVGEVEYEVGAAMRNPIDQPDLFASPGIVARRLQQFGRRLNLDLDRAQRWTFAQAVLSAVWQVEDGFTVEAHSPVIRLAKTVRGMLG